jgi:hypothetical protein
MFPCKKLVTLDPGMFFICPERPGPEKRPRRWLLAENRRKELTRSDLAKKFQNCNWDIQFLSGKNRVSEVEYLDIQGSVGGEIILGHPVVKTGWWRRRNGMAAMNHTIVCLNAKEAELLGEPYMEASDPKRVEAMKWKRRHSLAEDQHDCFIDRCWPREKFVDTFLKEVKRASKP